MSDYKNTHYLVETKWLHDNIGNENLRIFDCTTFLVPDPDKTYKIESGLANYEKAHIPGSAFIDIQSELSNNDNKLRFSFPDKERFEISAARLGISNKSHIVLYSCTHPMWATRVWWLFRTFGHSKVSVLNGGFSKWQADDYAVSSETAVYTSGKYGASFNAEMIADMEQVKQSVANKDVCILNALSRKQHSGEGPHYGRAGRIAGSEILPAMEIVDADSGLFLPAQDLQNAVDATSASTAKKVITYCGGGIAASSTLFALALLGHEEGVSLYDGSMSEWASYPDTEMEIR